MKLSSVAALLKRVSNVDDGCNCQMRCIRYFHEDVDHAMCMCTSCNEMFVVEYALPEPEPEPEFKFAIIMTGNVSVSTVFHITAPSVEHATSQAHVKAREMDFDDWSLGVLDDHFHIEAVEELDD